MKCFEKLVRNHIINSLPATHQFAYRRSRSTEDVIATALHATLSHLEQRGSYANTIISNRLLDLGLSQHICHWIKDFLSNRPQRVKVGPHLSSAVNLSTGSPQGCVLSPLLYTLYTHDCTPTHPENAIIKFADDTTIVGLISGGDETAYREEIQRMAAWCSENNLILNTSKTKELIIDFRRNKKNIRSVWING